MLFQAPLRIALKYGEPQSREGEKCQNGRHLLYLSG
jgi:hypothetical protein